MNERLVYTDHDGTLTDSQREMGEYSGIVAEFNAEKLGLTFPQSEELLNSAKAKILQNPGEYGWKWGKDQLIIAAATSDHYIFNQTATEVLLTTLSESDPVMRRKISELGGNEKYVDDLFAGCAPKLGIFYRPEAREFLVELSKIRSPEQWAVVTNAPSDKALKKLAALNLGFEPRVVGSAKKHEVNREWVGLLPKGPYCGFEGYPKRGIELQRQSFYNVLEKEAGEGIKNMIFIDDVAEFIVWIDFLSENNPDWSNAKTILLLTPMTPEWEKNRYSGEHKNRFGSTNLMDILGWISKQPPLT